MIPSASAAATLRAGIAHTEMTFQALWTDYFALGGMASPDELQKIIDGTDVPSHHDYDLITQAINEAFLERGGDHPLPYADEVGL